MTTASAGREPTPLHIERLAKVDGGDAASEPVDRLRITCGAGFRRYQLDITLETTSSIIRVPQEDDKAREFPTAALRHANSTSFVCRGRGETGICATALLVKTLVRRCPIARAQDRIGATRPESFRPHRRIPNREDWRRV